MQAARRSTHENPTCVSTCSAQVGPEHTRCPSASLRRRRRMVGDTLVVLKLLPALAFTSAAAGWCLFKQACPAEGAGVAYQPVGRPASASCLPPLPAPASTSTMHHAPTDALLLQLMRWRPAPAPPAAARALQSRLSYRPSATSRWGVGEGVLTSTVVTSRARLQQAAARPRALLPACPAGAPL